jgi:electron transfer flavoprotein alpha subunit
MSKDVFVLIEHHDGAVTEATHELLASARSLAAATGGRAVACLLGQDARPLAEGLAADAVLLEQDDALAAFVPEAYVAALAALIATHDPRLLLITNSTVGIDVAAPLAVRSGRPLIAYCEALALEGDTLVATSHVYGGRLRAEIELRGPAIVTVVGAGLAVARGDGEPLPAPAAAAAPAIELVPAPDLSGLRTRFIARREPDDGDVDITREDVLVSVGRGIDGAENIELAQELADALGGAVSGSRPVIDAGWLPKTRQVGKSGKRVKPRLYLACGISGAPEHLEGLAGPELLVAINTDPNAPIFDVADYGTTEDLFDVLPALVEALQTAGA